MPGTLAVIRHGRCDGRSGTTWFRQEVLARHPTAFERVAVVSDEDWLRPAIKALSLLLPGEAKAFPVRHLAAAKDWLAEDLTVGS